MLDNLFFETELRLSIPLLSKIYYYLSDGLDILKYKRHLKKGLSDKIIVDDILNLKDKLLIAAQNSDYKRIEFILFNILSESEKLSGVSYIAVSKCIEEVSVHFSKAPYMIETVLFIAQISFNGFFRDWYAIYNPDSLRLLDKMAIEESFNDSKYHGSFVCLMIFYHLCLKISEMSVENLIRVGNYLYDISDADSPLIRRVEVFDVVYLSLVILIAAKAKALDIEPIGTKLTNIIQSGDKHRVKEAFKVATDDTDEYKNKFTISGNNKIILATPYEVASYLKQFEGQIED
jgi:hypothetical protein